jgi:2-succinyl-5-enolpyruvyl-6-hydroxy-3-cyclohexene-1-carboxylate synthase
VLALARRLGWVVFADPRSPARAPEPEVVAAFDALLRTPVMSGWQPEVVVRVGPLPASKVLAQWLAGLPNTIPQLLLDPGGRWGDPDRRVSLLSPVSVAGLVAALPARLGPGAGEADQRPVPGGWQRGWAEAEAAAQAAVDATLCSASSTMVPLTEPAIARQVMAALPDGSVLMVSSSMPVRDLEWFAAPRRGVRVVANRGANGIDGVVSAAIGVALAGRPTVALLGDLAFMYDAGALLWAATRPIDLTLVVVDNDGGGIFSFLPQASAVTPERFERYWGTPHGLDLLAIAQAYGASTAEVRTAADLRDALGAVGSGSGPGVRVLRCPSDRGRNVAGHEALQAAVARAVAAMKPA